jgi:streptogramin lyase
MHSHGSRGVFNLFKFERFRKCTQLFLFFASVVVLVSVSEPKASAQAPTPPQLLPYLVTSVAGGAASTPAANAPCPKSGFTSTDKFGDGCLATEVALSAPRFAAVDKQGNIFFSDSKNALVRRIDATTGKISLVAGGAAANPAAGAVCGTGPGTSTSMGGDGCLGTAVQLSLPHGVAFAPNGDLYFADFTNGNIRKIAATNGLIQTTGVISTVVGAVTNIVGTKNTTLFGYNVNVYSGTTLTTPIYVATQTGPVGSQSFLNDPSGIAFDSQGNLYIADEGNNAIEVVNFGAADTTIMGLPVPVGTIAKLMGYGSLAGKTPSSGECPNYVSSTSRGGCYFAKFTNGNPARTSNVDSVYDVGVDPAGNVFFANEFNNNVGLITASTATVNNYAGIQGTIGKSITARGPSTSAGIGSDFGIAVDASDNLYIADTSGGVIWRVDAGSQNMYVMAGGAATACAAATDAEGDGCPATQATFSSVGIGKFASTNSPTVAGMHLDPTGDLFVTDAMSNVIRKISNGTQFGTINGSKPSQTLEVHFGINDAPAANAYTLTAGSSNFILGAAQCNVNSDKTTDCVLSVQATPTIPGPFSSTLTVTGASGMSSAFTLAGIFNPVAAPSVTAVTAGTTNGCSGATVAVGTQVTITSTTTGAGGTPTGTVTFFNGSEQIGDPQTLNSTGQASVTTSFASAGSPSITAVYNGDAFFQPSTSSVSTLNVVNPSFTTSVSSPQSNSIAAGQSALYSILVAGNVYTGSINFSCSGLPAGTTCVFSPATVVETGCSNTQTVALTIATTQGTPVKQSSFVALPFGRGPWSAFGIIPGLVMASLITWRRRKAPFMKYGQLWMAIALLLVVSGVSACSGNTQSTLGTPAGTSMVTVTAKDASGTALPLQITLTVH